MSAPAVTWTWDSLPTQVTRGGVVGKGRVLLTNLGTALLFAHMNQRPVARIEGAQVAPMGTGWRVWGTDPATDQEEEWFAAAVAPDAKPCGCGGR